MIRIFQDLCLIWHSNEESLLDFIWQAWAETVPEPPGKQGIVKPKKSSEKVASLYAVLMNVVLLEVSLPVLPLHRLASFSADWRPCHMVLCQVKTLYPLFPAAAAHVLWWWSPNNCDTSQLLVSSSSTQFLLSSLAEWTLSSHKSSQFLFLKTFWNTPTALRIKSQLKNFDRTL